MGKTVFEFIKDAIAVAGTAVSDAIKYALFLLNKAIFAAYREFRDVLVYAAYAIPFTDQLSVDMGGNHSTATLWRSAGSRDDYPIEEIAEERVRIFSNYAPFVPPAEQAASRNPAGGLFLERPALVRTAPYAPAGQLLTPDAFLDAGLGPDDMFLLPGLQVDIPRSNPPGIAIAPKNFGGAVANSIKGITLAEGGFPGNTLLPNYNLDGDRSYAWPCWDVTDPEPANPQGPPLTQTPLRPESTANDASTQEALVSVAAVSA
jgi:hypothetical protein